MGANECGTHDRAPGTHAVNRRTKKSILASAALAGLDFGVHAAGYWEHAEFPVHSTLRRFVGPIVLHAPAVEDAVDHYRQPLHPRLPARRAAAVIDDRPGAVLRQLPFDLPSDLLPILPVGFHRLLVDQLVHVRVAISIIVHFRTTRVVPADIIVRVIHEASRN